MAFGDEDMRADEEAKAAPEKREAQILAEIDASFAKIAQLQSDRERIRAFAEDCAAEDRAAEGKP